MSSDNYYIVRNHPNGGFASLMGFDSDDEYPVATHRDYQFTTIDEASEHAAEEYSEYGWFIHEECYSNLDSMEGHGELISVEDVDDTARYVSHPAWSLFGDQINQED